VSKKDRREVDSLSLKNKLNRMKAHLSVNEENSNKPNGASFIKEINDPFEIPFLSKWKENQTSVYWNDNQYCLIREIRYPITHKHGLYTFEHLVKVVNQWNENKLQHPLSSSGINYDQLFFFDTETTGLGGGAGTSIFLLGYAFIKNNEVVVRQHVLPKPGNEVAFYSSFLESVDYHSLVTYNGKAFDWPQVKTQHTLIKEHVPKLPAFGHFDLYHASRRFWKGKLDKVKLANVEKELLQIERVDDLPGYLAPIIYFDFIERQDPEGIFGIMKHNEWDVLSLITLYIHLSRLILEHGEKGNRDEALEIANWLSYVGESNAAKNAYEKMIEQNHEKTTSAKLSLSMHYKKIGERESAVTIWKEITEAGSDHEKIQSLIELAKWYEHKEKNIVIAEHYTLKAIEYVSKTDDLHETKRMRYLNELTIRIERLNKKSR
jgi:uncharacterized protein